MKLKWNNKCTNSWNESTDLTWPKPTITKRKNQNPQNQRIIARPTKTQIHDFPAPSPENKQTKFSKDDNESVSFQFFFKASIQIAFPLTFQSPGSIVIHGKRQLKCSLKLQRSRCWLFWRKDVGAVWLVNLVLPFRRAKNGPQNERTPNFGASKDTNMKNRRYRVQMW
jgi:hypothetical protein